MTIADLGIEGRCLLVTGASGFLGSHLTRRFVREGGEVHALVRRAAGRRLADLRPLVAEHVVDVTDVSAVVSCIGRVRPDVVVHLAGDTTSRQYRPGDWALVQRSIEVNLVGTLNVLRGALECGSVKTFVRAGGLEEYGNGATPHDESQRERPVSPYSASQVAATHFCQVIQQHTDSAIVTLRLALCYGPDQAPDFFIPAAILACLRGEEFAMSSGKQWRDLLYVDDAVEAFVRAVTAEGLHGAIVDLGHGEALRMSTVGAEIVRAIGGSAYIREGAIPDHATEVVRLLAATDAAREVLDWRPHTTLREGLERTVNWYRTEGQGLAS